MTASSVSLGTRGLSGSEKIKTLVLSPQSHLLNKPVFRIKRLKLYCIFGVIFPRQGLSS